MIVETKSKGKKREPLEDLERQYEARPIGLFHLGVVEKAKFDGNGKMLEGQFEEKDTCVIAFELVEEDTYINYAKEGEPEDLRPRIETKEITWSTNEKAGLFKIAKTIGGSKAAWKEGKKGKVNPAYFLGRPCMLTFGLTESDNMKISQVDAVAQKYLDKLGFGEAKSTMYLASAELGAHPVQLDDGPVETSFEDVPNYLLTRFVEDVLNKDKLPFTEEIVSVCEKNEAEYEANKESGGNNKATGVSDEDAKKQGSSSSKKSTKEDADTVTEQAGSTETENSEDADAKETPAQKRARERAEARAKAAKEKEAAESETVEYIDGVTADSGIAEIEAALFDQCGTDEAAVDALDDKLRALAEENASDDDYNAAVLALAVK